ncbi:GIY-YIG nuclease family protein [Alkalimarinus alittae]|uniref:GIY-YIG nuclease family protein n=1 Tax=Alkalimarinus alittae TaxID=2961619 RepID=A0ABY6N694_9ALTE|nr:GIY-YIG nuclease family protein [Alkalimarinus alittae]UZE97638.1 GIY-YIG nuclease family protein [Alkalimarinus alittae]
MSFHVYILQCQDKSFYTGHTDNLENRLEQHHSAYFKNCYTATRLPVQLVFQQAFETRLEALSKERQIKGWSRNKKQALIEGDWAKLKTLAKNRQNNVPSSEFTNIEAAL